MLILLLRAHVEEAMDLADPETRLSPSLRVEELLDLLLVVLVDVEQLELVDFGVRFLIFEATNRYKSLFRQLNHRLLHVALVAQILQDQLLLLEVASDVKPLHVSIDDCVAVAAQVPWLHIDILRHIVKPFLLVQAAIVWDADNDWLAEISDGLLRLSEH